MFTNNTVYEDSFEYFIAANVVEDDDDNEIPETEIDYLIDAAYRDVSEEVQDKIRRLMRRNFLTQMDEAWEDMFDD